MHLKRCEHCNDPYSAPLKGLMATLCRRCAMDCDVSYMTVYSFIREQDNHAPITVEDFPMIAEGSGVPTPFVKALFLDGRFGGKNEPQAKAECCRMCQRDLKDGEREMCGLCGQNFSQAVNKARTTYQPGAVVYNTQASPHASSGRRNQYGLGR